MAISSGLLRKADLPGRGRGLVASRSVKGGQVLLRESPFLLYTDADAAKSKTFCDFCVRSLPSNGAIECDSCSKAIFCNTKCQSDAATISHSKLVCKALANMHGTGTEGDFSNQARFLIAAYNLAARSPPDFEKLLDLSGSSEGDETVEKLHDFVRHLIAREDLPEDFSVDLTGFLLAKDKMNAFALMAPVVESERSVRAVAFYAEASLLNHDCLPNACRFDDLEKPGQGNTEISIRALHEIEEGTEVCISYFPINWLYSDRQKRLLEEYDFECRCERCAVEEEWESETGDWQDVEGAVCEDDIQGKVVVDSSEGDEVDDFPHAIFFVKYLCSTPDCGGTMAPVELTPDMETGAMECNMCGHIRLAEELLQEFKAHGIEP